MSPPLSSNDENKLSERLKRYGQLSFHLGSFATNMLKEKYLGSTQSDLYYAEKIKDILGKLKGPMVKVAQFLATIPGGLPEAYSETLLELQNQAPSMGWALTKRRMVKELGPKWVECFKSFEEEPFAAASLGQVHKAVLHTNEVVACKLQYPDIASAVRADLSQLKLILSIYKKWSQTIDTQDIEKEITENLELELDYYNEIQHNQIYYHFFKTQENDIYKSIHVPKIYKELSTNRLLTMEWMDGIHPFKMKEAPQEVRDDLGKKLFLSWYAPLYKLGVLHGDPHPGNYTITKNYDLNLLDFGCVRFFNGSFIQGVIELYKALQKKDRDHAVYALSFWGFDNLSQKVIDIMLLWASVLYTPLLDDRVRLIQDEAFAKGEGWKIVQHLHKQLQEVDHIRPPKEFVLMDRAAVGIGSVLMHLQAKQNWHQLFEELINNYSAETLDQNQKLIKEKK